MELNAKALIKMAEDFYNRARREFSGAVAKVDVLAIGIPLRRLGTLL